MIPKPGRRVFALVDWIFHFINDWGEMAMSDEQIKSLEIEDVYAKPGFYRWIALVGGLLAWTFDGVEQGVYGIMSRAALKDLVPGIPDLVDKAASFTAAGNSEEASSLMKQIDTDVGFYFGLAMAMWLWGAAAGGVVFGRLGDKYGRVRTLIFAVITYSAFTGLSAISFHWTQFAACRFLGAMGLGGAWPLSLALIVETWPEKNRSVLAGLMGAGANVGFFIASLYSRILLDMNLGWRYVIGAGCFIGLSSLLIIVFIPEPTKWRISKAKKQKSRLADLFVPRYRRSAIVGSLLSTVALLGTWGSFLWLSTYVDQVAEGTKYQDNAKATIAIYQSTGQIVGGFMGGVLAGLMGGNKRSWCFLCVTAWASVLALFYFNTVFNTQMMVMAAFAGLFVTAYFGWLPKYLSELFPTRIRGLGQGFSFNIGRVLAGFGVLGTGSVVAWFGGDYQKGAMVMCTIYLTGLIVILFAPSTGGKMVSDEEDEEAMREGTA